MVGGFINEVWLPIYFLLSPLSDPLFSLYSLTTVPGPASFRLPVTQTLNTLRR